MANHENRKRGYIHFVLEVPHLGEPRAWWASDEADYLNRAMAGWNDRQDSEYWSRTHAELLPDQEPDEVAELEMSATARRALIDEISGDDLSAYYVCRGRHEARALIKHLRGAYAPRIGKCGPVQAAAALEREVKRWN